MGMFNAIYDAFNQTELKKWDKQMGVDIQNNLNSARNALSDSRGEARKDPFNMTVAEARAAEKAGTIHKVKMSAEDKKAYEARLKADGRAMPTIGDSVKNVFGSVGETALSVAGSSVPGLNVLVGTIPGLFGGAATKSPVRNSNPNEQAAQNLYNAQNQLNGFQKAGIKPVYLVAGAGALLALILIIKRGKK